MFPSAYSFIVLVFTVFHYMFQPTWPGYFIFIYLKDSASLLFFSAIFHVVTLCVFSICVLSVLFSFVIFVVSLCVCLSACFFFVCLLLLQ
jgi:hypothetical protein